jgi:sugar lactone lactonase YvrE
MSKAQFRQANVVSRRTFLTRIGAVIAAQTLAPRFLLARPAQSDVNKPIILGSGAHTYEWVKGWAKLPDGMRFGNTHGAVVIDSQGRIFMNTDSEHAVIIFDPDGKYIKSWGKEFKAGTHGMALVKEGKTEYLYLTHTGRHEVIKATLDGDVVWTLGYPKEPNVYKAAAEFKPTGVAFAPNGDFYVTDGYGKFWVHQYNAKAEYIRSWGGLGSEPGKLNNPHGIWMDTRGQTPVVMVADRGNSRLQNFTLDGKHIGFVTETLRRPSNMDQRGQDIAVADLAGRVTILGKDNKVIVHLGDNPDPAKRGKNGVPPEQWVDGEFISPHCPRWDAEGNLYVLEWLSSGRITKLKRLK